MLRDKYKEPFRLWRTIGIGIVAGVLLLAGVKIGHYYPAPNTLCVRQDVAPYFEFNVDDPYLSSLYIEMCNGGLLEIQPFINQRPGILRDQPAPQRGSRFEYRGPVGVTI